MVSHPISRVKSVGCAGLSSHLLNQAEGSVLDARTSIEVGSVPSGRCGCQDKGQDDSSLEMFRTEPIGREGTAGKAMRAKARPLRAAKKVTPAHSSGAQPTLSVR